MKYTKQALTNPDLLARWQAIGLQVPEPQAALRALNFIGYPRLRGYALTLLRNVCAHHGRVWNRRFTFRPETYQQASQHFVQPQSFYCLAVVMRLFSRAVDHQDEWPMQLHDLFKKYPALSPADLGFPAGWEADPIWN